MHILLLLQKVKKMTDPSNTKSIIFIQVNKIRKWLYNKFPKEWNNFFKVSFVVAYTFLNRILDFNI